MANKNKAKGTAAETRVVKFINEYEGLSAERLALHGSKDVGDIRITIERFEDPQYREIHLEVKAGKQTQNPTRADLIDWLEQTKAEGKNSKRVCVLVIARHGKNPKDYDVYTHDALTLNTMWRGHLYLDEFIEHLSTNWC